MNSDLEITDHAIKILFYQRGLITSMDSDDIWKDALRIYDDEIVMRHMHFDLAGSFVWFVIFVVMARMSGMDYNDIREWLADTDYITLMDDEKNGVAAVASQFIADLMEHDTGVAMENTRKIFCNTGINILVSTMIIFGSEMYTFRMTLPKHIITESYYISKELDSIKDRLAIDVIALANIYGLDIMKDTSIEASFTRMIFLEAAIMAFTSIHGEKLSDSECESMRKAYDLRIEFSDMMDRISSMN